MTPESNTAVIAEGARVRALFQQRAIVAALGLNPDTLPQPVDSFGKPATKGQGGSHSLEIANDQSDNPPEWISLFRFSRGRLSRSRAVRNQGG